MPDTIIVLDFGSQYSQLITRRVREMRIYAEMFPWDTPAEKILELNPRGFILSGGPTKFTRTTPPPSLLMFCKAVCPSWASAMACIYWQARWATR